MFNSGVLEGKGKVEPFFNKNKHKGKRKKKTSVGSI